MIVPYLESKPIFNYTFCSITVSDFVAAIDQIREPKNLNLFLENSPLVIIIRISDFFSFHSDGM